MKPLFLLSKGERNRAEDGIVDTIDILIHYAEVYSDRMIYKGTPRDMPRGFISWASKWRCTFILSVLTELDSAREMSARTETFPILKDGRRN